MIVVIADDLSGAAEIASIAVAANLAAEVRTDLADLDFTTDAASGPEVVVFDSATRSDRPSAAFAKLKSFASRLRQHLPPPSDERQGQSHLSVESREPRLAPQFATRLTPPDAETPPLFKKVDSVLRGVILAELTALSEHCALLLPANPSRGRVIRDGRYFVRDAPLNETVFAADPEHPARTADVRQLLLERAVEPSEISGWQAGVSASETSWLPVHSVPVDSPLPESGLAVPDVESQEQLIARLHEWAGRGVVAGAADCFGAWLEPLVRLGSTRLARFAPSTSVAPPGRVFVCGSHAAWLSGRAAQCRARRVPIAILPEESPGFLEGAQGMAWLDDAIDKLVEHGALMLALGERDRTKSLAGGHSRTSDLADQLACVAGRIAARVPVGQWFLEGGATASAVVRRFGWRRLTALPMLAPGVTPLRPSLPASASPSSGDLRDASIGDQSIDDPCREPTPTVIVKPGSYDWPESVWQS